MNRYLLDTNIFVGIVRDAAWAISTLEELRACSSSSMFFTSVVCQGELYSLAEQRGWGRDRRADLEKALNQCFILDINKQQIIHAYALLDAWTKGKPVEHQNIPLPPKPAKKMSHNDLWIAATAHASGATLVSADKDFNHLNNSWIKFIYVSQS